MMRIKCKKCGGTSEPFDEEKVKDLRYIECEKCGRIIDNPFFEENKESNYIN